MSEENTRRSRAEWKLLVEQQAQSGLSQAKFCKEAGLSLSSFTGWKGKLKRQAKRKRKSDFVALQTPTSKSASSKSSWSLEITLPNQTKLTFNG